MWNKIQFEYSLSSWLWFIYYGRALRCVTLTDIPGIGRPGPRWHGLKGQSHAPLQIFHLIKYTSVVDHMWGSPHLSRGCSSCRYSENPGFKKQMVLRATVMRGIGFPSVPDLHSGSSQFWAWRDDHDRNAGEPLQDALHENPFVVKQFSVVLTGFF